MTALLVLERARPGDVYTAPRLQRRRGRVAHRPGAGGAHDGGRSPRGAAPRERQRRRRHPGQGRVRQPGGFVKAMNRRARELGLDETAYANPVGLDDPRGYSTARDLAALAARLMRNQRFARIVDTPQARLESGNHPRVVENRNLLIGELPLRHRGEDRPHAARGLRAGGSGRHRAHRPGGERRDGGAERGCPRRGHARASALRPGPLLARAGAGPAPGGGTRRRGSPRRGRRAGARVAGST